MLSDLAITVNSEWPTDASMYLAQHIQTTLATTAASTAKPHQLV
jgi:hypothetical protein